MVSSTAQFELPPDISTSIDYFDTPHGVFLDFDLEIFGVSKRSVVLQGDGFIHLTRLSTREPGTVPLTLPSRVTPNSMFAGFAARFSSGEQCNTFSAERSSKFLFR